MLRNLLPLITAAALFAATIAPASAVDSEFTLRPTQTPDAAPAAAPIEVTRINTFPIGGGIYGACIDFQNDSSVAMTAVRFDFTYTNAFNEVVVHFHGDRTGTFSPHVSINGPSDINQYNTARVYRAEYGTNPSNGIVDNCWTYFFGDVTLNDTHVQAVRIMYADGTSWSI